MNINSFTHRCVRDLAWVIASPPLVSGVFEIAGSQTQWWDDAMCLQEFTDCLPALQLLNQDPRALIAYLDGIKSKHLGLRFEGLISFWLSAISPNFKLLAQNIQLNEISGDTRSRTIGEVDFIIQNNHSEKVIHLEVAVKFYLGTAPFDDPYRWFGTNTQDQLGKKLDHLKHHQTQLLLQHPEQIKFSIDERQCFIKGRLFYPLKAEAGIKTPKGTADAHLRGHYLYYQKKGVQSGFYIPLEKSEWLASLTDNDSVESRVKNSIQSTFAAEERARCYARIKKNDSGNWEEEDRIFCLPTEFTFPSYSK